MTTMTLLGLMAMLSLPSVAGHATPYAYQLSSANRFGIDVYAQADTQNDTSAPPLSLQLPEAAQLVGENGWVLLYFDLLFVKDGDPSSCVNGCLPHRWQVDAVRQAYALRLRPVVRLGQWSRRIRDFADDGAGHLNFTRLAQSYKTFAAALPLPPDGSSVLPVQLLNEPNVCGAWQCQEGAHSYLPATSAAAEVAGCLRDLVHALRPLPRLALSVTPIAQVSFSRCECTAPFKPVVPQNASADSFVRLMVRAVPTLFDDVEFLTVHAYPSKCNLGFDAPANRASLASYQSFHQLVEAQRKRQPVPEGRPQTLPVLVGETGWQGLNQSLKATAFSWVKRVI